MLVVVVVVVGGERQGQSLSFCGPRPPPPAFAIAFFGGNAFLKIDSFILFWGAHPFLKPPIMGVSPFSSFEIVDGSPLF